MVNCKSTAGEGRNITPVLQQGITGRRDLMIGVEGIPDVIQQ